MKTCNHLKLVYNCAQGADNTDSSGLTAPKEAVFSFPNTPKFSGGGYSGNAMAHDYFHVITPPTPSDKRVQNLSRSIPMTNSLSIGTFSVRKLDNLFSLNDLHKASGNERKHLPAEFLRIDQTKALIAEIGKYGDSHISLKVVRGAKGGTYACKELVYAYAMWISATFMLQVIRAYDALQTLPSTINAQQQRAIQEAVNASVRSTSATHQSIYHDLKTRFKVGKYDQLPAVRFDECLAWIESYAPADTVTYQLSLNQIVNRLTNQLKEEGSYPVEIFLPLWQAINNKLVNGRFDGGRERLAA